MKIRLLYIGLLFSAFAFSQTPTLTQQNEPSIGETITMYECNSTFSNYSTTTGTGVVWDYSLLQGASGNLTKIISVLTPDVSDFSPATKMTSVPNFISSYWGSTSTDRTAYGFKFRETTIGDVIVKFNGDQEKLMSYNFAFPNVLTDTYSGTCFNAMLTSQQGSACTGTISSSIDGQGTLILAGPTSFLNVVRHKVVETTNTTFNYLSLTIPAIITRTQYDYYNTTGNTRLPIFSHITISISSASTNNSISLVLSSVNPISVGLNEGNQDKFSVYPNPTQGNVTLTGDFSENTSAVILDQTGRQVASLDKVESGTLIDISGIEKGIYFVVITNDGIQTTKTIAFQ
jgi:hypothetical protein